MPPNHNSAGQTPAGPDHSSNRRVLVGAAWSGPLLGSNRRAAVQQQRHCPVSVVRTKQMESTFRTMRSPAICSSSRRCADQTSCSGMAVNSILRSNREKSNAPPASDAVA